MNAIPSLAWVKRGVVTGHLENIKVNWAEIAESKDQSGTDDSSGEQQSDEDSDRGHHDNLDKLYNLRGYDNSDDEGQNPFADIAYHTSNAQDKNLDKNIDDEESEDAEIGDDDNMLAVGKVHGNYVSLECCVYNEAVGSLYCHNDVILSSFPLAMEWVGYDPGDDGPGNLLAIGGMEPDIEFWDLNIRNSIEPAFVLKSKIKKKGAKKIRMSGKGHTDAILDLSWNSLQGSALASGSADFTIGLWDIEDGEMVTSITNHTEKVQSLKWHPFERETLLSGSMDKTVKVFDCRSADTVCKSWKMPGEVERVIWNMHDPFYCLASTDTGYVCCVDIRSDALVTKWKAHNSPVTGLSMSSDMPGCVVTASSDTLVKVWDIRDHKPEMVKGKNFKIGDIHCISPCPDSGFVFALGGETQLRIFHLKTSQKILKRWEIPATEGSKEDLEEDVDTSSCSGEDEDLDDTDEDIDEIDEDLEEIQTALSEEGDESEAGVQKKKPKKKKKKKIKVKSLNNDSASSLKTNQYSAVEIGGDDNADEIKKVEKKRKKKKSDVDIFDSDGTKKNKSEVGIIDSDGTKKKKKKKKLKKKRKPDPNSHDEYGVLKSVSETHSNIKKKKKHKPDSSGVSMEKIEESTSEPCAIKKNKKKKKRKHSESQQE